MRTWAVTILADHEVGDGFEYLGTFLVQSESMDDAIGLGFEKAREMHPEVGDMQLDSVDPA